MTEIKRTDWHTTFDKDLKRKVNITAAELNTTANVVLEVAYIYLKANCNMQEARKMIEDRK